MKSLLLFFTVVLIQNLGTAQVSNLNSRGVGGGGALFFPKINPANDDEFFIACDMSELFHSTDFGQNYSQLSYESLPVKNTSTYEFTTDPNISYSVYNDGNDGYPVKTINGGQTWIPLPGHNSASGPVYRLTANYSNPAQIIINHYSDITISNDSGNSFQLIKNATNNGTGIILCGTFFDGNNIYVATNEGLFYSTDSGMSFSSFNTSGISGSQVIWHFSASKSGANTRFVCITADVTDVYNGIMPWDYSNLAKGVYTMDNTSGIWTSHSSGINFSNDFIMYSGMATNDIQTIYLAGNDNALSAPLVYKSIDGGLSWNKVFQSVNNQNINTGWSGYQGDKNWSWGETCFGIAVAPTNSNKIIFGDFGFVHVSKDGGLSWNQAYVNQNDEHPSGLPTPKQQTYHSIGLENTTCWQVHWQNTTTMLAAFSDIGLIRSTDAGQSWGFTYSGMSVNTVYRLATIPGGKVFAATSGIHDMYQSTRLADAQLDANDANGKIFSSSDDGVTWSNVHTFNHPVFWLDVHPSNPNTMYCSVIHYGGGGAGSQGGIWKTNDLNNLSTSTWTHLPSPPRTEGHPAAIKILDDGKVLCSFSGRRNASGAFTASSGVFLYDPTLNSWTDLSDPAMYYWTKDIVVDPYDPSQNTWYACVFSGWGGAPNGKGGVYRTINRGQTWTKLSGTQFDRVTSISFHPTTPDEAFITTETQGLWSTSNLSANLPLWVNESQYTFRQPERVFFQVPDEIWISSFGNGMKKGVAFLSSISSASIQSRLIHLFPNPCSERLNISIENDSDPASPLFICDIYGRKILNVSNDKLSKSIDVKDIPAGIYFVCKGNYSTKFIKK